MNITTRTALVDTLTDRGEVGIPAVAEISRELAHAPIDERRGQAGMVLFILGEAMLFVMLFFSYFYIGRTMPGFPTRPPKLPFALVMLAILLASSAILHLGERRIDRGHPLSARLFVIATAVFGVAFLVVQGFEYAQRLEEIRPTTDAYGSLFYLITGVHGLHVMLGLLMLLYVLMLPDIAGHERPPHRPLHNAALYWHFVDAVWIVIVALLYVMPNIAP